MSIAKYFWNVNEKALRNIKSVLKDPDDATFNKHVVTLLSRCDKPKELFSVISKKRFIEIWPHVRRYWIKHERMSDFRDWWDTIYEELAHKGGRTYKKSRRCSSRVFHTIGRTIKEERIKKGLSQKQLAVRVGVKQPDISNIEEGKTNITLFMLFRICNVLGIKNIDIR
ncbi:MAG: helix-turn-helix transcriptional regulator [Candidatus Omnitrophota bacterium]